MCGTDVVVFHRWTIREKYICYNHIDVSRLLKEMFDRREKVREIMRSLLSLAIILIVLWVIRTILLILPGIDIRIPDIPITYSMIVKVVMGVLMIFTVLKFGREVDQPMKILLESSLEIRTTIKNLIYLAAIGIAYPSFYTLVREIAPNFVWAYSLVLLIIAIFPIVRVAMSLYRGIDRWTDIISKRLIKPELG